MNLIISVSLLIIFSPSDCSNYEDNSDGTADSEGFVEERNGSSACITTDREDQGQPCVFPFLVDERLHYTCTTTEDPYDEEWCATTTNPDHSVRRWGHCSQSCRDIANSVLSLMVVGPTGVGKSTLLNSLLCPAKFTAEYEDCFFQTDNSLASVTKNITGITGPWLAGSEAPLVKVYDTPGLGDSDGSSDSDTLEAIVEVINSDKVEAILLVFKATDRFSSHIQKQLRTLEYILGSQLWDHVITVLTFWGFGPQDIDRRVRNCIKESKEKFDGDIGLAKDHCEHFDFEKEKVEEWSDSFEIYLGVTQRIPHTFAHPVFDYNNQDEREAFFASAMEIYNNANNMTALRCDEGCQKRLEIALKNKERTPSILGREVERFDAGEEIFLACHLYLGLENSTERQIQWLHNSSLLSEGEMEHIQIEEEILFDVTLESRLVIPNATFDSSGNYQCSTNTGDDGVKKSQEVHVKVLTPCKAGYEHLTDSEECGDTDECRSQIDDCTEAEICINTEGSWRCCLPGYHLGPDNSTCVDTDECQQGPGCEEAQRCFNTPGSFVCCDAGYTITEDNLGCRDVDECEDPAVCPDKNKECRNSEGGFQCVCIAGSYRWAEEQGDCLCVHGKSEAVVCQICSPGSVLVREQHRTFCQEQITECEVTDQALKDRLGDFPNYEQVTRGFNILRDSSPLGLTQATQPGFTSSHIFSVVRKDNLDDSCSFRGYIPDTAKFCQDSSTASRGSTNSHIEEVEVTYDESEAFYFSNSFSFGAEVSLHGGEEPCVDRVLAISADIGETLENNGQASVAARGTESSPTFIERFVTRTGASSKSESSNGWSQGKSRTDINTRFCEEEEGGLKITKSFSLPGYFESVKSSGRKCRSYKLEIDSNDPPSFTESFKAAVQRLDSLTVETRPHRLIVVKAGPREFNTTLNYTTERKFDSAFTNFISEFGTHYIASLAMGGVSLSRDSVMKTEEETNEDLPDPVALKPEPLLSILMSSKMMTEDRILASDGTPIDVAGILSWFSPRYSLLTDRCRALQDYRISSDLSSCEPCPPGQGPTEDFRECKPCNQLTGQRYSQDGGSCVRCPPGHWPSQDFSECLPCHQVEGVRYSEDRLSCVVCEAGTTPSLDSTQCLDCSLPGHLLSPNTTRCLKCSPGTWPSVQEFSCSPCNLLDGVRYSADQTTCERCPPGTTPTQDSTQCLDCSSEYNFYTDANKTRCAECPGGQGATEDHLGCHRIDGQWESWGSWTSCSKSCVGVDGELGAKSRGRRCTPPQYGGKQCDPAGLRETESCAGDRLTFTYCPVDGYWDSWTRWGSCSKTCGGGRRYRNRFCNQPQHGGQNCRGQSEDSKRCNTGSCPASVRSGKPWCKGRNFPGGRECCESSDGLKCTEGQGDCDSDGGCAGSLVCGKDNCRLYHQDASASDDCCTTGPSQRGETGLVSCGQHRAETCEKCTFDYGNGGNGEAWCNGECSWKQGRCYLKYIDDWQSVDSCPDVITVSGKSNINGRYRKQKYEFASDREIYVNQYDSDLVIAWDKKWENWWITTKASAGENSGRVWFQQESDQCPGQGSLTVREAGSDKYLPEVRVRVTY